MSDDQEFVEHISKILEKSLSENCALSLDLNNGTFIRPMLRKHFETRSKCAMEWILKCVLQDVPFDQALEDEIPILRRFYNEYIGREAWNQEDHTWMMVLNKYDEIKRGGYGNFAAMRGPSSYQ